MKRAASLGLKLLVAAVVWLLLLFKIVPLPYSHILDQIIPVIPLYALVVFGSYSLASIGVGVMTFRNCPEDHQSLQKEIAEAKKELKEKGLSF